MIEQAFYQAVYRTVAFRNKRSAWAPNGGSAQQVMGAIAVDQVTTAKLVARDGDRLTIDVQVEQTPTTALFQLPNGAGARDVDSFALRGSGNVVVDLSVPLPVAGSITAEGSQSSAIRPTRCTCARPRASGSNGTADARGRHGRCHRAGRRAGGMRIVRPGTRIVDRRLAVGAVGSRSGRDRARCARRGSDHRPGRAAGRASRRARPYRWVRRTTRRREPGRDDRRRHCAADDQPHRCANVLDTVARQARGAVADAESNFSGPDFTSIDIDAASYPGSGAAEAFSTIQAQRGSAPPTPHRRRGRRGRLPRRTARDSRCR